MGSSDKFSQNWGIMNAKNIKLIRQSYPSLHRCPNIVITHEPFQHILLPPRQVDIPTPGRQLAQARDNFENILHTLSGAKFPLGPQDRPLVLPGG